MIRTFSMLVLAAAAAFGISTPAHACVGGTLKIKTLTLNAEGLVTRSVYDRKVLVGEDGVEFTSIVPIVRDRIKLERGDSLNLNAGPSMVDASLQAEIYMKSQDRDAKGILSTTYHVVEVSQGSFGGQNKSVRTAYLATVKSNYLGDGKYSRGCGEVIRTDLDQESSTDAHHPSGKFED